MKKNFWIPFVFIFCMVFPGILTAGSPQPGDSRRIVGGEKVTDDHAWPWMAALVDAGSRNAFWGQYCGGALIHPNWVITAGHCVKDEFSGYISDPGEIDILMDTLSLVDKSGMRIHVKSVIPHPLFGDNDSKTLDSDIALLELETPITTLPVLPLYTGGGDLTGVDATVIGWGEMEDGEYPDDLYEVSLPIISNALCQEAFNVHDPDQSVIDDSMMCAGDADGGEDSCAGDSGGPLMIQENGIWKLTGLVSWGANVPCGTPGLYGVYARTSEFIDFIERNTGLDTDFAPPKLTVKTEGTEIDLSWTEVPGADGYRLYYAASPDEPTEYADMGKATRLSGSLPPGSVWNVAVMAYRGEEVSGLSPVENVSILEAPTLTVWTEGNTFTISWSPVPGADGYTFYYAPYPDAETVGSYDMGSRNRLEGTLPDGAAFYVAVRAVSEHGGSHFSNVEYFIIEETHTSA